MKRMTSDWVNARWLIWAPAFCSMLHFLSSPQFSAHRLS
jgi:hypothetical protein